MSISLRNNVVFMVRLRYTSYEYTLIQSVTEPSFPNLGHFFLFTRSKLNLAIVPGTLSENAAFVRDVASTFTYCIPEEWRESNVFNSIVSCYNLQAIALTF